MATKMALSILEGLEKRGQVREEGKGWRTHCPIPDHPDQYPSFLLYPGGGGRCFTQCGRYWPPRELAELLGITLPYVEPGLTLAELASAKGIPEDYLRSHGVTDGISDTGQTRQPCVDIPYANEAGETIAIHKRLSLEGFSRFIWCRGDLMNFTEAPLRTITLATYRRRPPFISTPSRTRGFNSAGAAGIDLRLFVGTRGRKKPWVHWWVSGRP